MPDEKPSLSLYIFLDEGGNFDFTVSGSKFFTLTGLTRLRPFGVYPELSELKYDILESQIDIEYFHASHDRQAVRDQVFQIIRKHVGDFAIDSLIINKASVASEDRAPETFYCKMLGRLLIDVLIHYELNSYRQVIIMTDRLPDSGKTKLEKAIKSTLKQILPNSVSYRLLHHQSKSNFNLQIVDYCNWAIYRKWERSDARSYELIKESIRSEHRA